MFGGFYAKRGASSDPPKTDESLGGIVGIDPNSNFGNRLSVMRYQAGD